MEGLSLAIVRAAQEVNLEKRSVEEIVRALNEAGVRYLIAGGLAVIAHGYLRFTADVDLILDLSTENLRRALAALSPLGYRPRLPVAAEQFLDPETRAEWMREKGMKVFSLISDQHPRTDVDLFVNDPLGSTVRTDVRHPSRWPLVCMGPLWPWTTCWISNSKRAAIDLRKSASNDERNRTRPAVRVGV